MATIMRIPKDPLIDACVVLVAPTKGEGIVALNDQGKSVSSNERKAKNPVSSKKLQRTVQNGRVNQSQELVYEG